MKNEHSVLIPADTLAEVQKTVNEANEALTPYASVLTPGDRHGLPKMGEKTLSFVEKAHDFAVQNPALCPPYLDMEAFGIDFNEAHGLWTLELTIQQLLTKVEDTALAAGSEAYQAALVFYNSVKVAAAHNVVGAQDAYDELKKRFPNGRGKHGTTETATLTETVKEKVSVS
jgi:hypothetical protein